MTRNIADTNVLAHTDSYSTEESLSAGRRAAFLTVVGNGLEFFDFASYAFFATIISRKFFAQGDAATALIQTFAVYGVGLLARPLGAVVFGRIGDVKGRKFALLVSMPLMGVSTLILGLLPTYEAIGVTATILLVACRLVQGFTAGGEMGNAITFLIEWSPPNKRALYSGLSHASATTGTLIGALMVAVLAGSLGPTALESWGWRIPFLFGGLIIAPVALWLRSKAEETPLFLEVQHTKSTKLSASDRSMTWRLGIKTVGATAVWVANFYVFLVYVPTYLIVHGKVDRSASLWITSAGLLTEIIFIFIAAMIADVIGRKPLYLGATACVVVLSYPLFLLFQNSSSLTLIFAAIVFCGLLAGIFAGIGPAIMGEMFPTRLRTTGVSIGFGVSAAVFGGFASLISETLIKLTGSDIAPSLFAIASALISLPFVLSLKETAHTPLE
ncbi:MFS transporter, MHS family, proline/betaine transporter [Caballeronia arationis]|jgi:MHS family proline/betaine transporter-like MFS transporter|uniref:MFS transporter, MHS family, proline/betaine transporter n=1 Tax=Caballeronia arationis TaxID=1777142 RepID=A0A7Z7I0X4_9BURK|nr:MFS transporter [Caballeronia arationis]SOE46254.1 MFS transporter, MHS family, proline/betaine transporter [Caballeronia arationis]